MAWRLLSVWLTCLSSDGCRLTSKQHLIQDPSVSPFSILCVSCLLQQALLHGRNGRYPRAFKVEPNLRSLCMGCVLCVCVCVVAENHKSKSQFRARELPATLKLASSFRVWLAERERERGEIRASPRSVTRSDTFSTTATPFPVELLTGSCTPLYSFSTWRFGFAILAAALFEFTRLFPGCLLLHRLHTHISCSRCKATQPILSKRPHCSLSFIHLIITFAFTFCIFQHTAASWSRALSLSTFFRSSTITDTR